MQGNSNVGRLGQLNLTLGGGGKFHTTIPAPAAPQAGHHITGTIVELSDPDLLVEIHVFVVMSVLDSMETPVGKVVMVEVTVIETFELSMELDVESDSFVDVGNKDVVLSSILRTPDDAKDTDTVPLVKESPGFSVIEPMTTPEPFSDTVRLGARVNCASRELGDAESVSLRGPGVADISAEDTIVLEGDDKISPVTE